MARILLSVYFLLVLNGLSYAQAYKCTDQDGQVLYNDTGGEDCTPFNYWDIEVADIRSNPSVEKSMPRPTTETDFMTHSAAEHCVSKYSDSDHMLNWCTKEQAGAILSLKRLRANGKMPPHLFEKALKVCIDEYSGTELENYFPMMQTCVKGKEGLYEINRIFGFEDRGFQTSK